MANIKQVNVIERIQQLYRQGASQRRIARELGVSRNTVARYAGKTPGAPVGGGSVSGHATHGAKWLSLRIAILSCFVNNGRQTEPQATHGAAQFDKKTTIRRKEVGNRTKHRHATILPTMSYDFGCCKNTTRH